MVHAAFPCTCLCPRFAPSSRLERRHPCSASVPRRPLQGSPSLSSHAPVSFPFFLRVKQQRRSVSTSSVQAGNGHVQREATSHGTSSPIPLPFAALDDNASVPSFPFTSHFSLSFLSSLSPLHPPCPDAFMARARHQGVLVCGFYLAFPFRLRLGRKTGGQTIAQGCPALLKVAASPCGAERGSLPRSRPRKNVASTNAHRRSSAVLLLTPQRTTPFAPL